YLPESLVESGQKWPLVLSLHGAYSNYANNMKRLMGVGNKPGEQDELAFVSLPIYPELPGIEAIVLCPWGRGTMGYHGPGARDVLDVLDLVMGSYPVDPERVSVTGLSMGGNGTWEMALHHTGLFAAAVPVCAPNGFQELTGVEEITPEYKRKFPYLERIETINRISNFIRNAQPLKLHIHHGTDDPVVPFAHSGQMAGLLAGLGIEAPLTGYDNVGHNSWDPAYRDAHTLKWLLSQRREKPSREISFTFCRYEDARYEWVEVRRLAEYGKPARVDLRWKEEAGTLEFQTGNISRMELDLARLPGVGKQGRVKLVSPRGKKLLEFDVPAEGTVKLEIKKGGPRMLETWPADKGPVKKKGLEGPIYEVLCDRVVLVHGTRGPGAGETLEQLKRFADWGELPDVHFIIKPDTGVTDQDIATSHLVLFGDPESNTLLKRINSKLPVRLEDGKVIAGRDSFEAAEVAFKCVFPNPLNPDKLILWNYVEEWDYSQIWFYRSHFGLLPDYFFYRRGGIRPHDTELLKAGFFDSSWNWE
ncbi:MAG: prolyl oligopeptidase family serine peptidase, partial [Gemmatimonadota bacterium]|nr:prolyl oligopeptidase family serine peptidase [Gemmatimonadota bacterium]